MKQQKYTDNYELARALGDNPIIPEVEETDARKQLVKDLQKSWEDVRARTERKENTQEEQLSLRIHLASQTKDDNSALRTQQVRESYVKGQLLADKLADRQSRGQSEEDFEKELVQLNAKMVKAAQETEKLFQRTGLKTAEEVYGNNL